MPTAKKIRLDLLLQKRGIAESREKARLLLLSGQVRGKEGELLKPGGMVLEDFALRIFSQPLYVSQGGVKLALALDFFKLDCRKLTALDIGASTGGFTHCLLEKGAQKVYALDVGKGQLHQKLRTDPRVAVKEGINARYLQEKDLPEKFDLITIDVAFISLKLILPKARLFLKEKGEILSLIKPQFEAGKEKVKKGGIVKDKAVYQEVLEKVLNFAGTIELYPRGLYSLPHLPRKNQEFFALLGQAPAGWQKADLLVKETLLKLESE